MELKDLQNQLQTTFENLKEMGERQSAEVKQFGEVTQETKTAVETINTALTELKGRIDEFETKANRMGAPGQDGMTDEQKAARNAFFKFVREGKAGLASAERKALVEDAQGQILVPEALDTMIYTELPRLSVMRELASVRRIGVDRIRRRSLSDVTVGWGKLETTAAKLSDFESTPTPDQDYIYVEDAYGLVKIGEDELEDSDVNLEQFLADAFAAAYAEAEDRAFILGTGHANHQPEGILRAAGIQRVTTAAAGALDADDLLKLAYALPAQYRKNGSYIVNSKIELAMRLLKDNDGQYLWQPGLQAGRPSTFNGNTIYNQDDMDGAVSTTFDVAIFGDVKAGYQIADRTGGTIQRLNELYIEDGLIGFKFKRRVGGGVVRTNAFRILAVQ